MNPDLELLRELCLWLSGQKGMIPQSYAKELAKVIIRLARQSNG